MRILARQQPASPSPALRNLFELAQRGTHHAELPLRERKAFHSDLKSLAEDVTENIDTLEAL